MNDIKRKLLLAALLSFTVGTVGCAADHPFSTPSLHTTRVLLGADQVAKKSPTTGETTSFKIVSHSANPAAKNQSGNPPAEPVAQVTYQQTVQPLSNALAVASLTTLGPNDDLAELVAQASGVVLVDFYADWCGPCRTQGGILHEMELTASQHHASIIKVNVDQHRRLASALNVTSLPTLMLIKDGQIIERQSGVANHQRVAALLSK